MGQIYHLSNPTAARLVAIQESTSRIIAIRIIIAVLLVGWLAFVGTMAFDFANAVSGALSSAASNIKISVQ